MTGQIRAVLAVALATGSSLLACAGSGYVEPEHRAAAFPLAQLQVQRNSRVTPEVYAELAPGVALSDVVEMAIFDGFSADITPESALVRHGQPAGRWIDPVWASDSPYYEGRLARLSIAEFQGSNGRPGWKLVAYPRATSPDAVFQSEPLRKQLLGALPPDGEVHVVVARPIGFGRIEVLMNRKRCQAIVRLEEGS